jgi:hypothetical protein
MPLDNAEKIDDALAALGLGSKILVAVTALPPVTPERPRKAADFKAVVDLIGSDLLPFIDKVAEDIRD